MEVKEAHTAIFLGQTVCVKTHYVLNLLKSEYKDQFEYILIIFPTLLWNRTYLTRSFIRDPGFFLIEPGDKLFKWIEILSQLYSGHTKLFIIDDVFADELLDKHRQSLLDLATFEDIEISTSRC